MTVDPFVAGHRASLAVTTELDGQTTDVTDLVDDATVDVDTDARIPARLNLTARPGPWDALGQRVRLVYTARHATTTVAVDIGTYLVTRVADDAGRVTVEASSLLQLVDDARFVTPRQPPASATYAGELAVLLDGIMPVDTSAMTDRPLASNVAAEWVEDRYQAVADIAREWPATLTVDPDGILTATPPATAGTPLRTFAHGTAGAYLSYGDDANRFDVYNAVVARGQNADGVDLYAVAYTKTGPTRWAGPFGQRPRFHYSPLITSTSVARTSAATMLAREQRRAALVTVMAPPDPRLVADTRVAVVDDTGRTVTGAVVAATIPLTPATSRAEARYLIGLDQ